MEHIGTTGHIEWLNQIAGQKVAEIPQLSGANIVDILELDLLDSLVVSSPAKFDWDKIKQSLIPVELIESDDEKVVRAARVLRMTRASIMTDDAFLVLVKDENFGGDNGWVLSIINPNDLSSTPEDLFESMSIFYSVVQMVMATSKRAAYLALSG
jgi:hypothetical protein